MCFAFGVDEVADNNYNFKFYYNDISAYTNPFANGIPDQSNPVWEPNNVQPDMSSFEVYQRRSYGYLHSVAANSVLKVKTEDNDANIALLASPVPGSVFEVDNFLQALAGLLPLITLLAYIPPVYNTVFRIVKEKETGAKESMRMMGMADAPYWLSWWVYFTIVNTIVSALAGAVLNINIINHTSKGYIFLFFWLYGEAVFGQIMFLQSFFSTSKFAGIIATIIYFGASLVNQLLSDPNVSRTSKILASILPQAALQEGAIVFA